MEARINSLDNRVERMEDQLTSLAESMQRFADGMTTLVRMDERMGQLLIENRAMGERLGSTQNTVQQLQIALASLKTEVVALQDTAKGNNRWAGQAIFYFVSLLIAIALARQGINVGIH